MKTNSWLSKIEALRPGDPCEVRGAASREWLPAIVIENGGAYYWKVRLVQPSKEQPRDTMEQLIDRVMGVEHTAAGEVWQPYIEQIRLPGQTEAWPR